MPSIKRIATVSSGILLLFVMAASTAQETTEQTPSQKAAEIVAQNSQFSVQPIEAKEPPDKNPSPSEYNQSTDKCPQLRINPDREWLDLVQQCRAAVSSERMISWTMLQFMVSILTLVGLAANVIQTRRALMIAEKANVTASENNKAELRAYVSPQTYNIRRMDDFLLPDGADGGFLVQIKWKNLGLTPAYNVETSFRYKFMDQDIPYIFGIPADKWTHLGEIPREDIDTQTIILTFTKNELAQLFRFAAHVVIKISIRYRDIFNRTIEYHKIGKLGFITSGITTEDWEEIDISPDEFQSGEVIAESKASHS